MLRERSGAADGRWVGSIVKERADAGRGRWGRGGPRGPELREVHGATVVPGGVPGVSTAACTSEPAQVAPVPAAPLPPAHQPAPTLSSTADPCHRLPTAAARTWGQQRGRWGQQQPQTGHRQHGGREKGKRELGASGLRLRGPWLLR